jgi:protein-tyrosine phosphatase
VPVNQFTILCVCTANICRSPVAAGLLSELLGPDVQVCSAGIYARPGAAMAEPMARRLRARSSRVADFAARRLSAADLASADLVLGMTKGHRAEVVEVLPAAVRRTFTLKEFARLADTLPTDDVADGSAADRLATMVPTLARRRTPSPSSDDIADPYGRAESDYDRAFAEIDEAAWNIARAVARI